MCCTAPLVWRTLDRPAAQVQSHSLSSLERTRSAGSSAVKQAKHLGLDTKVLHNMHND